MAGDRETGARAHAGEQAKGRRLTAFALLAAGGQTLPLYQRSKAQQIVSMTPAQKAGVFHFA